MENISKTTNNDNTIEELAWIAFLKIQIPEHKFRGKRQSISQILKNDIWWRKLNMGQRQQIGKIIRKEFDSFESKYGCRVVYKLMDDKFVYVGNDEEAEEYRDYIYHYTSFDGFLGIIKGKIWLANSLMMNDKLETKFFLDRMRDSLINSNTKIPYKTINNFFKKYDLYTTPTYLTSFTYNEDDAAQWDRYGGAGGGVCLAFDKENLERITKGRSICFENVMYNKEYNGLELQRDLEEFFITKNLNKYNTEDELFRYVGFTSSLYKHPSFMSENEYRMIYCTDDYKRKPGKLHYDKRNNTVKEYNEFDWLGNAKKESLKIEDIVPKIILGPRTTISIDNLRGYLKEEGYIWNGEIVVSDCPLR